MYVYMFSAGRLEARALLIIAASNRHGVDSFKSQITPFTLAHQLADSTLSAVTNLLAKQINGENNPLH